VKVRKKKKHQHMMNFHLWEVCHAPVPLILSFIYAKFAVKIRYLLMVRDDVSITKDDSPKGNTKAETSA